MRIISALLVVGTCYSSNVKTNNFNRKRLVGGLLLAGLLAAGAESIGQRDHREDIESVGDVLDVDLWQEENLKLYTYTAPSVYETLRDYWTPLSGDRAKKTYLEYIERRGVDLKGELIAVQDAYRDQAKSRRTNMELPRVVYEFPRVVYIDITNSLTRAEMKHLIHERIDVMWKVCERRGWYYCEEFARSRTQDRALL